MEIAVGTPVEADLRAALARAEYEREALEERYDERLSDLRNEMARERDWAARERAADEALAAVQSSSLRAVLLSRLALASPGHVAALLILAPALSLVYLSLFVLLVRAVAW